MKLPFGKRKTGTTRASVYIRPQLVQIITSHKPDRLFEQAVNSQDEWASAIEALAKQARLELQGDIVVILSSQLYQQLQVEKPSVPDEELASAVPWAIKDMVAEPVTDLVVDYYDAPTPPMGGAKLNVVCVRRPLIQRLVDCFQQNGWALTGITTESLAVASAEAPSEHCQMLVWQVTGSELELLVLKDGQIFFSRHLRAFSRIAQLQEIEFSQDYFDSLSLELQRSIDFITASLKQPDVSQIHLSLPTRFGDRIVELLQANLSAKVSLLEHAHISDPEQFDHLPLLGALQSEVLP